jgi:hypothetical protein
VSLRQSLVLLALVISLKGAAGSIGSFAVSCESVSNEFAARAIGPNPGRPLGVELAQLDLQRLNANQHCRYQQTIYQSAIML